MSKGFKFEPTAAELMTMLARDKDEMTAFGISDDFISIGTFNGYVHFLFMNSNEGMVIGPFSPIKDICCLGEYVAYLSGRQITLYNPKNQKEYFTIAVQDAIKVSICSNNPKLYTLVCATRNSLIGITKGWMSPNTKNFGYPVQGVSELTAHGHLACVVDFARLQVLSLTEERSYYETAVQRGYGKFHWMSNTTLIAVTGLLIEVISYSQSSGKDELNVVDRIELECIPFSIASFNQSHIVLLSANLVILTLQKKIIFTGIPPINGKLLSNNKNNSPFFLAGSNQLYKVELPNIKEKIRILVHEFKFEKAYIFCEQFKIDTNEVLYPQIEYFIKLKQFEDAAQLISSKLQAHDKYFVQIIEKFIENNKLPLIARSIPYIDDENLNLKIFVQLNNHRELLREYIEKWPLVMLTKSSMIAKIKSLGFNDILIDNFIKLGKTTEALKIALEVKSMKCFEILNRFPETFSLFVEIPNFLPELFALDCAAAGRLCEDNHWEIKNVIDWLPPELIANFLMSYDKITQELEKILFEVLLNYFPSKLIEFANRIKYMDINFMLEALQSTNLDNVKVFLLRKLNNKEEVLQILQVNFDVRLKYLKHYPDLWPKTLLEATESVTKIKKVLGYLHYYENSLEFVAELNFKEFEPEIKEFIKRQGKILDIYQNSVNAAKIEQYRNFCILFEEYKRGVVFNPPFICCKCAQPLTTVRLRKCGHHSHKDCFDQCIFCVDPSFLSKF